MDITGAKALGTASIRRGDPNSEVASEPISSVTLTRRGKGGVLLVIA
jgi:hypothetical protein